MIVLLLAIMVLLYRRDPNPGLSNLVETPPAETPPPEKPENEDVEVYSLEKNECRMDKHGKVICPACNSKLEFRLAMHLHSSSIVLSVKIRLES